MRLDGQNIIVTGGGSGFGAEMCRRFVREGARVLIADINAAAAHGVADSIGENAVAHRADVN